jgi:predicted neutral ceramidase superfamily lipid hydrolase
MTTPREFWIAPIQQRAHAEKIIRSAANSLFYLVFFSLIVFAYLCLAHGLLITTPGLLITPKVIIYLIGVLALLALCLLLKKKKSVIVAFLLMVFPCGLSLGLGLTGMIMGLRTFNQEGAQDATVEGALLSLFWLPFTWSMYRAFLATIKLKGKLKNITV